MILFKWYRTSDHLRRKNKSEKTKFVSILLVGVNALSLVQRDGGAVVITKEVDEGLVLSLLVTMQGRQRRQLLSSYST